MALVTLKEILQRAHQEGYGVGNFDVFNMEMVKGVLQAAEEMNSPVILAYGEGFDDYISIEHFSPLLVSMAQQAKVPVCIHLDHAVKYSSIVKAIHYGFTSVMVDASDKPFAENIKTTQQSVALANIMGVSVEAELGHVSGLGDLYANDEYIYTDVKEAVAFVQATNIDALAIAVGTIHGEYKEKPRLNIDRIREIRSSIDLPLVLHGGSGLSDEDFRNCIKAGISKVNIFTDLVLGAIKTIRENNSNVTYMEQCYLVTAAVKKVAVEKMRLFDSKNKNWI